ncbi:MAG: hypothetical protein M3178_11355 [Pseudomonadota bacterium]|nr:hypothetical protein [Pseudomonadota bacterium]
MDINAWLLLAIFVVGLVALIGFFLKMEKGFGPFNTSSLLLLLVVTVTALLFVAGKLEAQVVANIFFAVIGFAGGLFTGKDKKETAAQQGAAAHRPASASPPRDRA